MMSQKAYPITEVKRITISSAGENKRFEHKPARGQAKRCVGVDVTASETNNTNCLGILNFTFNGGKASCLHRIPLLNVTGASHEKRKRSSEINHHLDKGAYIRGYFHDLSLSGVSYPYTVSLVLHYL